MYSSAVLKLELIAAKQVEFYLSDENLVTDMHLKVKLKESGDNTLELKHILGFPKMRRFKPKTAVIAALRQSHFLNVSVDSKRISRKIPYVWADSDIDSDYEEREAEWKQQHANRTQGRPKPNIPGISAKPVAGMDKPTGFEEGYNDGPITPDEYAEERQTYDPDEPIQERLSIAVHRFSTRRKFHQNYALIFTAFMKYGGVDGRGNAFASGDVTTEELQNMAPGQIAHLKSTFDIGNDKDPEEGIWTLDFEHVCKGFLYMMSFLLPKFGRALTDCATQVISTTTADCSPRVRTRSAHHNELLQLPSRA